MPDRDKYVADTNPSNPTSPATSVSFPSSANRNCDLEAATTVLSSPWFTIATDVPGSGNLQAISESAIETTRQYRARAKIPAF